MCGLAGYTGNSSEELTNKYLKSILYRGPDENGKLSVTDEINFCHSRLSIIDLKNGKQPMELRGCVIIFNGEIYNYIEIKKFLMSKGYKFVTNSDTEVLLNSYIHFGDNFTEELNGMFSFALYDKSKKKLIISNDPFSIKPLYYSVIMGELNFSSSAKTLTLNNNFKKELNNKALRETIQFRYSLSGEVLYKGIEKLKPGETIIWDNNKKSLRKFFYNHGVKNYQNNLSENEWIDECYEIFNDSIKINLRSDVPIGIFLSSGIDSAGILHFASKNGYQNLKGYTYSTKRNNDETNEVKKLSEKYNLETQIVNLKEDKFFFDINEINKKIDFPILDSLIFPINELCKVASKDHKVILTGEGADEMFGGYFYLDTIKKIRKLKSSEFLSKSILFFIKKLPIKILNLFFKYDENLGELGRQRTLELIKNFDDYKSTYINSTSLLNNNEIENYTNLSNLSEENIHSLDFKYLQKKMINTWLPNQICTKSDQLSMAHGLETRVPFLDKRILNLILNIPEKLLINQNNSKVIYRKILKKSKYRNFNKPKKAFYVSIDKDYKKSLRNLSLHYLSEKYLKRYNFFKKSFVDHSKYHFEKGEFLSVKRIIMMCLIHNWMDNNFSDYSS